MDALYTWDMTLLGQGFMKLLYHIYRGGGGSHSSDKQFYFYSSQSPPLSLLNKWVFATNWFSSPNIFATQCRNLRYFKLWILLDHKSEFEIDQRFGPSGYKDIRIKKLRFWQRHDYFGYCIQISSLLCVKKVVFIIWTFYDIFLFRMKPLYDSSKMKNVFF